MHYAKPQQNDHSGLSVMVRQAKPTYTAGDIDFGGIEVDILSRHVPSAPIPFGNSSFHTCRAWRCELPSKLEVVLIPLEHWLENYLKTFRSPIHVFAYRTHAHSLGSVISGYR